MKTTRIQKEQRIYKLGEKKATRIIFKIIFILNIERIIIVTDFSYFFLEGSFLFSFISLLS